MNLRGTHDKDGSYLDDPRRAVRSEKVWAAQRTPWKGNVGALAGVVRLAPRPVAFDNVRGKAGMLREFKEVAERAFRSAEARNGEGEQG